MPKKLSRREKEDRFLDYVATHKAEITRYLIVALAGEILLWAIARFAFPLYPPLERFIIGIEFLCWGLPYFALCKLWVWRQKGDGPYVLAMQGLKFVMCFIVIFFICLLTYNFLCSFTDRATLSTWLMKLLREILYFFAMMKIVIRPDVKKY